MKREQARRCALEAIDDERGWQEKMFPVEVDDVTVHTDLNHMVSVLAKYIGALADEAVHQSQVDPVDWVRVSQNGVKVAAVSLAVLESLVATGRIQPSQLQEEGREIDA